MKVTVENVYSGLVQSIEGDPEHVERELCRRFPWLNSERPEDHGDVEGLIERLNASQAFEADLDRGADDLVSKAEPEMAAPHVVGAMLGADAALERALDAAKFLAGGKPADPQRVREAAQEADGDPETTALLAYGLEPSKANLEALRGICGVSKAETQSVPAQPDVEPGHPDARDVAEEVRRAFQDQFVVPVQLGGRHSRGSLLARDRDTSTTWLLKPDSGGVSPAKGVSEEPAPMARRDAAFWHVADAWGLGRYIPETQLLLLGGRDFAAIELLPWSFKLVKELVKEHPARVRVAFDRLLREGVLHRLGVLFAVLGETDGHAGNEMMDDLDLRFIDHGGAWAGPDFDPAHDRNTFTPFFLRYGATGSWNKKTPQERLAAMPRVDRQTEESLRAWVAGLDENGLAHIADSYGINPEPAMRRLQRLKDAVRSEPADLAINRFWVEV